MAINRSNLADLSYFLALARHRSFRAAGLDVGVSASAISHALKGLEGRIGMRLFNRTSRSVTLTAAGEELLAAVTQPVDAIEAAFQVLGRLSDVPRGRIRLNVLDLAATLLLAPILPTFIDRYLEVEVELSVTNRFVDVVEQGFDAGIRFGGTVPADMIARRLTPDFRWVVAGSPEYFERFGIPTHPNDLARHRCCGFRLGDGKIYRWEFEKDGEELDLAVPGTVVLDDGHLARALALRGAALTYMPDTSIAAELAAGRLRTVLTDWAPSGGGFQIYYSSRNHVPEALRLLVDLIREMKPIG